jgi:hypothetical protein
MAAAKRTGKLPPWLLRSRLAGPSVKTLQLLGGVFLGLTTLSVLLSPTNPHLGLFGHGEQISVYTSMWQVQAGISALALPVLVFVIERFRDEPRAALHSSEVMMRESLSFLIIGLSFVVVGRMGVDLAWFSDNRLIFLTDLVLLLLTVAGATFAYFAVLRLIFSPSRLKDRSLVFAKEKQRDVVLVSARVRIGNNLLFARLRESNIDLWPFGTSPRQDRQFLILDAPKAGYFADVHLTEFERFVARLPWRTLPAEASAVPTQPTPSQPTPDRSVWLLRRYGERMTDGNLGLVRLERASFTGLSKRTLEGQLSSLIRISESDEL